MAYIKKTVWEVHLKDGRVSSRKSLGQLRIEMYSHEYGRLNDGREVYKVGTQWQVYEEE